MNTPLWRASLRLAILHAMVGGTVLLSVGAIHPASVHQANTVIPGGSDASTDNTRIVASGQADWDFGDIAITVEVVEKPQPVAKRVSANPTPPSVAGNSILEEAAQYVGTPYLRGGTTPAGFDCSGFVSYVYAQFGVSLPHTSSAYWSIGTRVSAADALPGDLIVSNGHVGIFAGGNMQIDSPREGKTIQFRSIWQTSYVFVRVS